jgi:multisubunit Na+/H+ antiporter MnhF subunit
VGFILLVGENNMKNLPLLKTSFKGFKERLKATSETFQASLKTPTGHKALAIAAFLGVMQLSQQAMAFAQVFTVKGKELIDNVVIIGYTCVGIALVFAIIGMMSNRGPNWKVIGTAGGAGVALTGFHTIWKFFVP